MWNLLKLTKSGSKEDKKLVTAIKTIAGFSPSNLELYKLALLHSSKGKEINGFRICGRTERALFPGKHDDVIRRRQKNVRSDREGAALGVATVAWRGIRPKIKWEVTC